MEIEHLATVPESKNYKTSNGSFSAADWRSMDFHFATVQKNCPALEGVGASEAIYSWLDYYSPNLVVRFENPKVEARSATGQWQRLRWRLCFLGSGILSDEKRVYSLVVTLPGLDSHQARIIRFIEDNRIVFETGSIPSASLSLELALSERNQHQFALELERDEASVSDDPVAHGFESH